MVKRMTKQTFRKSAIPSCDNLRPYAFTMAVAVLPKLMWVPHLSRRVTRRAFDFRSLFENRI